MAWQDRMDADQFRRAVRKLVYEDGLSASQAARALGSDVTKNMCIRAMQTLQGKRTTVTFPDSVWPSTAKGPGDKATDVPEVPVHLVSVREGQCRAPLWPDFVRSSQKVPASEHMMCGKRCKDGSAYCDEHHALFYPTDLQRRVIRKKPEEVKDNSRHFK